MQDSLEPNLQQTECLLTNWLNYPYLAKHLRSGGRLNKKDGLTRYGDSHVKD